MGFKKEREGLSCLMTIFIIMPFRKKECIVFEVFLNDL